MTFVCEDEVIEILELEIDAKKALSHTLKKWQHDSYFDKSDNKRAFSKTRNKFGNDLFRTSYASLENTDISKQHQRSEKLNKNWTKLPLLQSRSEVSILNDREENSRNKGEFEVMAKSACLFTRDKEIENMSRETNDDKSIGAIQPQVSKQTSLLPKLVPSSSYYSYNQFERITRKPETSLTAWIHRHNYFSLRKRKTEKKNHTKCALAPIKEVPENRVQDIRDNKLPVLNSCTNEKSLATQRGHSPSSRSNGNIEQPSLASQPKRSRNHKKCQRKRTTINTVNKTQEHTSFHEICLERGLWIPKASCVSFYK